MPITRSYTRQPPHTYKHAYIWPIIKSMTAWHFSPFDYRAILIAILLLSPLSPIRIVSINSFKRNLLRIWVHCHALSHICWPSRWRRAFSVVEPFSCVVVEAQSHWNSQMNCLLIAYWLGCSLRAIDNFEMKRNKLWLCSCRENSIPFSPKITKRMRKRRHVYCQGCTRMGCKRCLPGVH